MMIGPLGVLLGIAVHARTHPPSYDAITSSPEQDARVLAYADVLRQTRQVTERPLREQDAHALRAVAGEWVRGAAEGRLRPLEPVCFGDSIEDGAKEQIFRAEVMVARRLGCLAKREAISGALVLAAEDAMLSLEVVNVLRYSDFSSVRASTVECRRAYHVLERVAPALSRRVRQHLAGRLQSLGTRARSLEAMVRRARRQFLVHQLRMGVEIVSIEEAGPLMSPERSAKPTAERAQALQGNLFASTDTELPKLVTQAQLASLTHAEDVRREARVLDLLTK